MTVWQAAAFLLCVAVATGAQMLTGFAFVLVLISLSTVFELASLPDAVNVAMVLAMANAAVALRGKHKALDWAMLRPTILGTFAGVAAGVALLAWLSANALVLLRLLLGLVVVGCAFLVLRQAEPLPRRSRAAAFGGVGVVSGLLAGLFSAGGPPLVWHFYRQPIAVQAVRDALIALLAVSSLMRAALVVPTGQFSATALWLSLLALPVVTVATWWLRRHPPQWRRTTVLKLVWALLVATGAGLVGPALQALVRT